MFFRRPHECYVTCRDRDDGGGAQISAQISAMIYARLKGVGYAHTPLANIAHQPDEMSPETWSTAWESFFSLGEGETQAADLTHLEEHRIEKPHRQRPRAGRLNVVAHCHKLTNKHPEEWAEIAPEIRRKYLLTPKPELSERDPGKKHIAVHLRRGDVGSSGQFSERFTPTERVLPALRALAPKFSGNAVVHLYSQGTPDDFPEFTEFNPVLHLDEDVFESFHGMVTADVLFTAKSTFSYLAALINEGQIIYEPFWHPPLPGWNDLDKLTAAEP